MRGMWKAWGVLVCALSLSVGAHSEDVPKIPWKSPVRGYLVDLLCSRQRAGEGVKLGEAHTKMCLQMPPCESSGYAVMTLDNQIYKFDDKGNEKARKLLDRTNQPSNFFVLVSGKVEGDEIEVRKIELVKSPN